MLQQTETIWLSYWFYSHSIATLFWLFHKANVTVANDIDYESVFSFSVERYGEKGDILICVSSSGNSPNIIKAIKAAKTLGMITVSFVGFSGGKARDESDYSIYIPNENYGVVEDTHHSLMHILAQYVRIKSLTDEENLGNVVF